MSGKAIIRGIPRSASSLSVDKNGLIHTVRAGFGSETTDARQLEAIRKTDPLILQVEFCANR